MPMCFHSMALTWFDLGSWFTNGTDKPAAISKNFNFEICPEGKVARFGRDSIISAFTVMISCWSRTWLSRWAAAPPKWNSESQFWSCQLKSWWSVLPRICAVGLVGLVRLAGLVGHHQIKNENATFQTSNQCIPTFKQRRDELYLVSQGTILLELWKMCVWLKNINGNKWLRKWQNCVGKASYRWPQQSLHFREGYAPSPQYTCHFLGSNRSMSPRLLETSDVTFSKFCRCLCAFQQVEMDCILHFMSWSAKGLSDKDKLWQASGGSLGFDSCPSWSKDFRFATANSRSLRGWIVDITRQCTASSDATMVSGHETWLTVSAGAEDKGKLCPRTFGGIMMWNGSTRGLSMKRQPEQFFLLFGWQTLSASFVSGGCRAQ